MRLKEFQEILAKESIDACVLLKSNLNKNDSNITYFSNLDLSDFCCLIIYQDKPPIVIVPKLEFAKAKRMSYIKNIITLDNLWEQLNSYIKARKIGINFDCISIKEYQKFKNTFPNSKIVDISTYLINLRKIKTQIEINKIREACKITDEIIEKCIDNFKKFKTEAAVMEYIESQTKKLGLLNSFQTIVASGRNAALPHHITSKKKLKRGFCVIDFGIKFENYCSDMTRTLFIGKPSEKEKGLYNLVLKAQLKSIKNSKIGVKVSDVEIACRKILGKYEKYFIHSLGHQIGIDVHEGTFRLSSKSNDILQKCMVFTIEPGIYINDKLGIRIEDTVLLENICIPLTKFTKELITINL